LPQEATKQRWTRSRPVWAREKDAMKEKHEETTSRKPRRTFDEAYRRHAVELTMSSGRSVKAIAEALGIAAYKLYKWREQYAPLPGVNAGAPRSLEDAAAEIRRLRTEVIRLRERELILKKSLGILSETPESGMPTSKS
jgi:transposase